MVYVLDFFFLNHRNWIINHRLCLSVKAESVTINAKIIVTLFHL